MLAELTLQLKSEEGDLSCYQSSNLQGVLMSSIDSDYAATLHQQGLNPYSLCLLKSDEGTPEWHIRTLTDDAYTQIILPLMEKDFDHFTIEKKGMEVKITQKTLRTLDNKALLDEFYSERYERYIPLIFRTPAAFKVNGRYWTMPDIRLIFQSLMNKYSASSDTMEMHDEETLNEIMQNCSIGKYHLHSTSFPMESVWIPAFAGNMVIRIDGSPTMAKYARLLCRFGEFSGVGIKTGMGMGAIQIDKSERKEGRDEKHDRS